MKNDLLQVDVEEKNAEFESKTALEVLKWALDEFHPDIATACSLGAEDVVLVDMLTKLAPRARIFTLDTGRLNQETYDVMDTLRKKYNVDFEVYFPHTDAVEKMVRENGVNLFYESIDFRKLCCGIRKIEPLKRALSGLSGWITGLRREQSVTRTELGKVELDESQGGIVKVNPLADWTQEDVWDYIREHDVPYNALHDRGFPSIGCAPCTRAIEPGEDLRAGRWWWESPEEKECGLHIKAVDSVEGEQLSPSEITSLPR